MLIRVFARVIERFSNVKLVLKGNDDLYTSEQRLILSPTGGLYNQLKDKKAIEYYGSQMSNKEISELHQASNCYVSPYSYEGFNLPVLESMAVGGVGLVSEGGSTDDFFKEEYGRKIRTDEVKEKRVSRVLKGFENEGFNVEGYGDDEFFENVEIRELKVDEEDFFEKMVEMVRDGEGWMEEGRRLKRAKEVRKHYSWDVIAGNIVEVAGL
ncbi:hypothetical protein TL16_g10874 [Triparma laevis f. inornata]|uniref:Glycosyl transferase family 1 domain-containing protein n=2 Tax=Triparma laevis TaxID=1534972 RepID=A0A9W7B261_9STRA|nr:hypothetical protein TrLO_g2566 [Triparma laevis f. longispina]GMH87491.1 hypothetical protein TL16_g10874 [Triparma laevis f. inornata]